MYSCGVDLSLGFVHGAHRHVADLFIALISRDAAPLVSEGRFLLLLEMEDAALNVLGHDVLPVTNCAGRARPDVTLVWLFRNNFLVGSFVPGGSGTQLDVCGCGETAILGLGVGSGKFFVVLHAQSFLSVVRVGATYGSISHFQSLNLIKFKSRALSITQIFI